MKNWILFSVLFFAFTTQAKDDSNLKNLKNRVDGYVQTMLEGERAAILSNKDYYTTVYLTQKATVEEVIQKPNGNYQATVRFETIQRIHQDAEFSPIKKSEVKKKEDIRLKLNFQVKEESVDWLNPLESPFVKPGKEKRYILNFPAPEKATKKK